MQKPAASARLSKSNTPSQAESPRLAPTLLDNFWLRMATMYGHAWVSQYGASPDGIAADTWGGMLAGMTPAQLSQGLRAAAAIGGDWPPSAPKFRALCFGIPTLAVVRAGITKPQRSPYLRLVWQYLDHYRFARADERVADRMLKEAHELATNHLMSGGPMPLEPVAEIAREKAKRTRAPEDVERAELDRIAGIFLRATA